MSEYNNTETNGDETAATENHDERATNMREHDETATVEEVAASQHDGDETATAEDTEHAAMMAHVEEDDELATILRKREEWATGIIAERKMRTKAELEAARRVCDEAPADGIPRLEYIWNARDYVAKNWHTGDTWVEPGHHAATDRLLRNLNRRVSDAHADERADDLRGRILDYWAGHRQRYCDETGELTLLGDALEKMVMMAEGGTESQYKRATAGARLLIREMEDDGDFAKQRRWRRVTKRARRATRVDWVESVTGWRRELKDEFVIDGNQARAHVVYERRPEDWIDKPIVERHMEPAGWEDYEYEAVEMIDPPAETEIRFANRKKKVEGGVVTRGQQEEMRPCEAVIWDIAEMRRELDGCERQMVRNRRPDVVSWRYGELQELATKVLRTRQARAYTKAQARLERERHEANLTNLQNDRANDNADEHAQADGGRGRAKARLRAKQANRQMAYDAEFGESRDTLADMMDVELENGVELDPAALQELADALAAAQADDDGTE